MIPLPRPVAGLVPHAGSMCLLDQVIECGDDHIVCSAVSHRSPNNPLRDAGRLSVSAAIEYAAQAMAAHGALCAAAAGDTIEPRPGMLVATRGVMFAIDALDDLAGALRVEARALTRDARGLVYDFSVDCAGASVATGRLTVALRA